MFTVNPDMGIPYPFELGDSKGAENIVADYLWAEMTWPEIEEKLNLVDLAILPCGSIEQHGPHLPVDVDAFDAEYLAKKSGGSMQYTQTFRSSSACHMVWPTTMKILKGR